MGLELRACTRKYLLVCFPTPGTPIDSDKRHCLRTPPFFSNTPSLPKSPFPGLVLCAEANFLLFTRLRENILSDKNKQETDELEVGAFWQLEHQTWLEEKGFIRLRDT